MTLAEMKDRKRELGFTNKTIADKSGLPLSTVQKIFSGATTSPREETIRALEAVLRPSNAYPPLSPPAADRVQEAPPAYGAEKLHPQGTVGPYTLEDYLALPDEQRVELIDGYFYDMAAPTTIHQALCGFIFKKLLDHVMANHGPCYPFVSPVDVQLDSDDKTVVQPDVMVVCDRGKYKNGRIFGAPDLLVEVLSPSTRRKDMQLKYSKYLDSGVREYWMVDPVKKSIVQYDLANLEFPAVYGFDADIPVLIWDGACTINLRELTETAAFLWE